MCFGRARETYALLNFAIPKIPRYSGHVFGAVGTCDTVIFTLQALRRRDLYGKSVFAGSGEGATVTKREHPT